MPPVSETRGAHSGVHPHFRRPVERPFLAHERASVTVLFGGLTATHERLIGAVLQGCGYRAERVAATELAGYHLGRYFGNTGQCNPAYFTVGALIQHLRQLEAKGLSRRQIIEEHVFLTAGGCGPCRFGMYEAEYRLALENAGFGGFRVLVFNQSDGLKAATGEPGLKFSVHLGLGVLNAFVGADILNDLAFRVRPYERQAGQTNRALEDAVAGLAVRLRDRTRLELRDRMPEPMWRTLSRWPAVHNTVNVLAKVHDHLHGRETREAWQEARQRFDGIDVDWLQVKPVVKIAGEFWAQTTEGDGNFRMFAFLEREGAEVRVEPVSTWLTFLVWYAKERLVRRHRLAPGRPTGRRLVPRLEYEWQFVRKLALLRFAETRLARHYRRVIAATGGLSDALPDLDELGDLARGYYDPLLGGGEGHLEVGKLRHCARHRTAHLLLSLKPFGCMPSTQSDGVQSAVLNQIPGALFLPVETSGDGAVHAYSRAQMALGEARARAQGEFSEALATTGRSLDDIRAFVSAHPALRRPWPAIPRRPGVIGTAANFVLHVSDLMRTGQDGRASDLLMWTPQ
jgi:predicted nucleotide-binding protein (sugar kinase/HSP70/actin superfamily)